MLEAVMRICFSLLYAAFISYLVIIPNALLAADCTDVLTKFDFKQTDFYSDNFYYQHQIFKSDSSVSDSREVSWE
jgi:hypothetical protein